MTSAVLWSCMACGTVGHAQSCAMCGAEAMPGEWAPRDEVERLRTSQEELLSAIGTACPVHLVADGPIRLIDSDWQRIEAAAIKARRVLDGVGG